MGLRPADDNGVGVSHDATRCSGKDAFDVELRRIASDDSLHRLWRVCWCHPRTSRSKAKNGNGSAGCHAQRVKMKRREQPVLQILSPVENNRRSNNVGLMLGFHSKRAGKEQMQV
eukprot:6312553-Prymnesium_polylepis.2